MTLDGETLAVVSLSSDQVRPIGHREIAHARAGAVSDSLGRRRWALVRLRSGAKDVSCPGHGIEPSLFRLPSVVLQWLPLRSRRNPMQGRRIHEQTHFRHRRRGQFAGQRTHQRIDRHVAGTTRTARPHAKTRPVYQRRSRHDEPLPARRGLRARRRQRDRPRPWPLRAIHQQPAEPRLELYHRTNLSFGD